MRRALRLVAVAAGAAERASNGDTAWRSRSANSSLQLHHEQEPEEDDEATGPGLNAKATAAGAVIATLA